MPLLDDASPPSLRCPQCGLPWKEHPQIRCEACSPGYESDEAHCHEYVGAASVLYRTDRGVFLDRRIVP